MMDCCNVIGSTAKTRELFDPHRKLARCSLNSVVLTAAESYLLLPFPSQVVIPSSNIKKDEEVRAEIRRIEEKETVDLACRKAAAWQMPTGLDATQPLLGKILQLRFKLYEDCKLYKKCRRI